MFARTIQRTTIQPRRCAVAARVSFDRVVQLQRRAVAASVARVGFDTQVAHLQRPTRPVGLVTTRWQSTDAAADDAVVDTKPSYYVTTAEGVQEICDAAKTTGIIAFDTEFHLEKSYFIHLALLQVSVGGKVYCVDPLSAGMDLTPFEELMTDKNVVKIVHAAKMDVQIFWERTQEAPCNVFDTQVAAGLLGHGIIGYGDLVKQYCGVTLKKGATMSDWLKRPLDGAQLAYAEDDVRYLEQLYTSLRDELTEKNRLTWVSDECAKYEEPEFFAGTGNSHSLQRLRKVHTLSSEELVLASRLTEWRDQAAAACNKPRNFIMRDDAVLDLSKLGADSPRPLIKKDLFIRTLHPRAVQNYAPRLLQLLKAPVTDEQMDECTKLVAKQVQERSGTRQEQAKIKSVLSLSQAYYAVLCQTVAVEPSLVASDAELKDLISAVITGAIEIEHGQDGSLSVSTPSSNRLLSGWRYEIVGQRLLQFLTGSISVRLDPESHTAVFEDVAP